MKIRALLASAFLWNAATAAAQVPPIAPDTIYKLAVDSAKYPEQATVILLDDGVITVESDGRETRTYHQITQVLRQRAVQGLQERQFTYDPDHQRLTINAMRVLGLDGHVISGKPALTQESDMPAARTNPIYEHRKVLRLSLSGVAPGTLVDAIWTIELRKSYRQGDFFDAWRVTAGTTVLRSRYIVDAPKDMQLRIVEHHLDFPRRDTIIGSRKIYQWTTHDVAWIRPEPYAPPADSNDLAMNIDVAAPGSWSDIGKWYAGMAVDRLRPDQRLRDTVRGVVAGAGTLADSVHAVHRWVAQDIRYVAVALGQGGYQPRFPDEVLSTGFGDCKDKATLLIDALAVLGIEAYPVLINAGGKPDSTLPTIRAFNHEIVAIKRTTGYQFVDPTSSLSRFETLPGVDAGQFALVVHGDGVTEPLMTPPAPPDSNHVESRLTGILSADESFSGRVESSVSGQMELGMRALLQNRPDSTQRAAMLRNMAGSIFPDSKGDSLVIFDGKDFKARPVVSFVIRSSRASQQSGDIEILTVRDRSQAFARMADEIEARGPRHQPIDASRIMVSASIEEEVRITLPDGWHARLPHSVNAAGAFGHYEATYRQDGRDLVMIHRTTGAKGIYAKERVGDLVSWLRECAKDRVPFIALEHQTQTKS
ncbi:MAG TPA: DUF3857 domain-containing protein [Gemmatimonadaceae bacterium]|jgi:hypothetical protein|nr:DUF3857 domain-containing protein [Gemmatimonadaceae bacterium]